MLLWAAAGGRRQTAGYDEGGGGLMDSIVAADADGMDDGRLWRRRIDIIPDFCSVVGRGGRGGFALLARKSHRTSRHSMKPHGSTPTYVGIVRVHSAYSNQQILKIPNCVLTSYVDSLWKKVCIPRGLGTQSVPSAAWEPLMCT